MSKPLFSIVLICRNEAKALPKLIASLKEFKRREGQIVLCDTGSTDGTPDLARSLGCEVTEVGDRFLTVIDEKLAKKINKQFIVQNESPIVKIGDKLFDYSSARNFAATLANCDMIATPDCDECYTKLDIDRINSEIQNGAEQLEYQFVFSHDEQGREAIKFLHCKFYNRKKLSWTGIVHEVLTGSATRKYLDESIIKLEHWQNPSEHRSRYLTGLALDCYLHPENDRNSHYFAREMLWQGRPLSAIKEFKRHIAMNKWHSERAQSMIYVGDALLRIGKFEEGLQEYHRAILTDGNRREPWLRIARFCLDKKDYRRAICYGEASLTIPLDNFYANFMGHYTYEPHEILYIAYGWVGNLEKARYHNNKALEFKQNDSIYLRDWSYYNPVPKVSIIIPSLGREDKLKRLLELIPQHANYPNYEIIVENDSFENRLGVPKILKKAVEKSTGEYVMFLGNDCIPTPNFLIIAVRSMLEHFQDGVGLIGLNDGYWELGEIATHWMASKKLLPMLDGEFFHTSYKHLGCDNELTERCRKVNKYFWEKNAMVYHDHPIHNNFKETDPIYQLAYNDKNAIEDRQLLVSRCKLLGLPEPKVYERPTGKV